MYLTYTNSFTFLQQTEIMTESSSTDPVITINPSYSEDSENETDEYEDAENLNKKTLHEETSSYSNNTLENKIEVMTTKITDSLMTLSNENQETQARLRNLESEIEKMKKIANSPSHHINTTSRALSPDPEIDFPNLYRKDNSQHENNLNMKIKPPKFDGKEDLYEFIDSFKICCEINQWNYEAIGLYLASSLSGDARSLLTELNGAEKKDYDTLFKKLTERYGCLNRVEVFRTQLRTRIRKNGEEISELARSIKKLSHQAYPEAPLQWTETIAVDCFIDAMQTAEMRIKLREANVKTLSEAEQTAIRLETFRTADQQRHPTITVAATGNENPKLEHQNESHDRLKSICDSLENLTHQFQKITQNQTQNKFRSSLTRPEQPRYRQNNDRSRRNNFQHSYPDNSSHRKPTSNNYTPHRQPTTLSGNENKSFWRPTERQNNWGRRQ